MAYVFRYKFSYKSGTPTKIISLYWSDSTLKTSFDIAFDSPLKFDLTDVISSLIHCIHHIHHINNTTTLATNRFSRQFSIRNESTTELLDWKGEEAVVVSGLLLANILIVSIGSFGAKCLKRIRIVINQSRRCSLSSLVTVFVCTAIRGRINLFVIKCRVVLEWWWLNISARWWRHWWSTKNQPSGGSPTMNL